MSLNKAIEHKKEKRKQYRKAKAIDPSCRNHGTCPYCYDNRTKKDRFKKEIAEKEIEEAIKDLEFLITPTRGDNSFHKNPIYVLEIQKIINKLKGK